LVEIGHEDRPNERGGDVRRLWLGEGAHARGTPDTDRMAAAMGTQGSGKRFLFNGKNQPGYFDNDPDA